MTNEEFQKAVLEQFEKIDQRFSRLEAKVDNLPTREELHAAIKEQQKDVMALLQLMDSKLTDLQDTQIVIQETIGKHEISLGVLRKKLVAK